MLVAARGVPCLLPMPCLCAWTSENNSATNLCWLFSTWHAGSKLRTHTNAGMCGAMEGSHSACVLTACTRSDEVPTHPPTHPPTQDLCWAGGCQAACGQQSWASGRALPQGACSSQDHRTCAPLSMAAPGCDTLTLLDD
jgi:hypothetical protein